MTVSYTHLDVYKRQVYGILRLINFAHGDIFTVAGFLMVYATASLPLTISIPLVVVATVLLGIAVGKVDQAQDAVHHRDVYKRQAWACG